MTPVPLCFLHAAHLPFSLQQIKKSQKSDKEGEGCVRATFEDKILQSDIVFMRAWVAVEIPRLYVPVTSLLAAKRDGDGKSETWRGMRTVAELRREQAIPIPVNPNSVYKPIERVERVFQPLKVPRKLQAALPFKSKPKQEAPRKRKTLEQKARAATPAVCLRSPRWATPC